MVFTTSAPRPPPRAAAVLSLPSGYASTATVAVALLSLTVLAVWLLARTGRAVGEELGGGPLHRGVHGMKVAAPYAAISYGASWPLHLHLRLPQTSPVDVVPSRLAPLFLPLAI